MTLSRLALSGKASFRSPSEVWEGWLSLFGGGPHLKADTEEKRFLFLGHLTVGPSHFR